jgi:ribosomal protein L25 (general stress protein Ctc)
MLYNNNFTKDTTAILKNSWHQSQGHNVIFSQKSKHENISITYVEINSVYFNLGRDQLFYIRYNDIRFLVLIGYIMPLVEVNV